MDIAQSNILICYNERKNIFAYCCDSSNQVEERLFPKILSNTSKYFRYEDCRFSLTKEKEKTARGFIHKYCRNNPKAFTIESSYMGYEMDG